jgi:polyphosphate kinase 2 (PPK2 family)
MLDAVDLQKRFPKASAKKELPKLQEALRKLQYAARDAAIPTVIVMEGFEAAGKGDVIRKLAERLDPRLLRVHHLGPENDVERRFCFLDRYFRRLPADGEMAIFDGSWYFRAFDLRATRTVKRREAERTLDEIAQFERWLADDGQVVVKFFFHLDKKTQRKRLEKIEDDPAERWRVGKAEWRQNRRYDRWLEAAEAMCTRTESEAAPWTVVESTDEDWVRVKVYRTLVERLERAVAQRQAEPAAVMRTKAAKEATRVLRAQRDASDAQRARDAAAAAGLTIEGEPLGAAPAEAPELPRRVPSSNKGGA